MSGDARDTQDQQFNLHRSWFGLHQIPNALCVGRVVVVYVAMYFLLERYLNEGTVSAIWLALASVAALTDKLDGFLAKKYGWTSRLGAYLDQMSDKMVTFVVYAALTMITDVGPWVLAGIVFRELLVTGLRTLGNNIQVKVPTSQAGRLKTFYQQVAALVLAVTLAVPGGWGGFAYMQYVVWGGMAIFWSIMIAKGSRSFKWLRSVYTVELKRPGDDPWVSPLDYYLVVSCFLMALIPFGWLGATTVLYITLGTGFTYAVNFIYSVSYVAKERGWSGLGRAFWIGSTLDIILSIALSALLWMLVLEYRSSTTGMAALVCGYSLLFAVFLVINYRTSEEGAASAASPATEGAEATEPGLEPKGEGEPDKGQKPETT